jgi:hypothetical protein
MTDKRTRHAHAADPAKVALQVALASLQAEVEAGAAIKRATLDAAREAIEAMAHKLDSALPVGQARGALPPGSRRRVAK